MAIRYQEDEYVEEEAEGMFCERCGHSFQLGESAYDFKNNDGYICADCVEAYVDEKFYFIPYPEYFPDEDKPFEEWRDNHPEEWEEQLARNRMKREEKGEEMEKIE